MPYVIRSMSTTDYVSPDKKPEPYHIYLMRPELRRGAWWSQREGFAMVFPTFRDAELEWIKHWHPDKPGRQDIAPVGRDIPPIWEKEHRRPRPIG